MSTPLRKRNVQGKAGNGEGRPNSRQSNSSSGSPSKYRISHSSSGVRLTYEDDDDIRVSSLVPPPCGSGSLSPRIKRFVRERANSLEELPAKLKKLPTQKRFWFSIGILLGFVLPSFLLAPKVMHVTGITETDIMDDFLRQSLIPFISERIPIDSNNAIPRPGKLLADEGASAKHPVFLVPGFITTGLELWQGEDCAKRYFRQRMWGSTTMVQNFLTDRECWARHLKLNTETGKDPLGVKLRAASGFEAADYIIGNYWVWSRIIENLADVGYDSSNMEMFSYDWRMSPKKLEERDGYFTKLKAAIEIAVKSTGEKCQLISHSMGTNHMFYFLQWVEKKEGGGGGSSWVANHVAGHINIAGPLLGTPKALTSILSGEMRDTAEMSPFEPMIERMFGRVERRGVFSTWGSIWTLMSKGGNKIWGDGPMVTFTDGGEGEKGYSVNEKLAEFGTQVERSTEEFIQLLVEWGGGYGKEFAKTIDIKFDELGSWDAKKSGNWHNPLTSPLPKAPSFTHYCLYGVGLDTEDAYFYKKNPNADIDENLPYILDTSVNDPDNRIRYGVRIGDGDATVPLISLGFMCRAGWKKGGKVGGKLNPHKSKVHTREYPNEGKLGSELLDPLRQGPKASDHVDIMGNVEMIEDVVRIATGFEGGVKEDRIVSEIDVMAKKLVVQHVELRN